MGLQLAAHLPLAQFDAPITRKRILETVNAARQFGYWGVSANDHVIFSRPWLDGPSALAMSIPSSGDLKLCTTISQPVIRGPLQLAKTLITLSQLSEGRVVAGIGPGSSSRDYIAAGIDFDERWPRFESAARVLRALLRGDQPDDDRFYPASDVTSELRPRPDSAIPIWIGSWGSPAGLRRVARLADGWLASGYNTTPEEFAEAKSNLAAALEAEDRQPADFPNSLATMWTWVTEDRSEAERMLSEVLGPAVKREPEYLAPRVCVGSAEHCAELLSRYAQAGLERVFLWPLGDEPHQLELMAEQVMPAISTRA